MAHGCSLSPILFSVFINDLLIEVEKAGFRIGRSCTDNVYVLNEVVQGRLKEDKGHICILFRRKESL